MLKLIQHKNYMEFIHLENVLIYMEKNLIVNNI